MPAAAKGNRKQAPARRCCQGHPGRMRCPRSRQCLVVPGGPTCLGAGVPWLYGLVSEGGGSGQTQGKARRMQRQYFALKPKH